MHVTSRIRDCLCQCDHDVWRYRNIWEETTLITSVTKIYTENFADLYHINILAHYISYVKPKVKKSVSVAACHLHSDECGFLKMRLHYTCLRLNLDETTCMWLSFARVSLCIYLNASISLQFLRRRYSNLVESKVVWFSNLCTVVRCQVYDQEWSFGFCDFGTGVFSCAPKSNPMYTYRETVPLGRTMLAKYRVNQIVRELGSEWAGTSYDLLSRNCNHFCEELCMRLGVQKLPCKCSVFAIVIWASFLDF